jgi:hypothetical protein
MSKKPHLQFVNEVIVDPITKATAKVIISLSQVVFDFSQEKVFILPIFTYIDPQTSKETLVPSNTQIVMPIKFDSEAINIDDINPFMEVALEQLQIHLVENNVFGLQGPDEIQLNNGNNSI